MTMTAKRFAWNGLTAILLFLVGCAAMQPNQVIDNARVDRELADARKQMEELQHRLSVIQFMVDSHEKAILDLKRSAQQGLQTAQAPPPISEPIVKSSQAETSADDEYNQAFSAMKAGQYAEAALQFSEVARNHPNHDLADNALYWSGECLYSEKKYNEAIAAFNQVVEQYPKQNKAPDALLKIGFAYLSLGNMDSARHHLNRLIQEHPDSEAGIKARQKLKQIQNP